MSRRSETSPLAPKASSGPAEGAGSDLTTRLALIAFFGGTGLAADGLWSLPSTRMAPWRPSRRTPSIAVLGRRGRTTMQLTPHLSAPTALRPFDQVFDSIRIFERQTLIGQSAKTTPTS
jgi:hypothetical protein